MYGSVFGGDSAYSIFVLFVWCVLVKMGWGEGRGGSVIEGMRGVVGWWEGGEEYRQLKQSTSPHRFFSQHSFSALFS